MFKKTAARLLRATGMVLLVMGLSACLYEMRQKALIPYQVIAITGSPSRQLLGQLQVDFLTYLDVKVAVHPVDADLLVEILQDAPNSQIASSTSSGQISGYDLNDIVVFRAFDQVGHEVISPTEIYGVRDINFSPHSVLSADIQQQQMIEDIRKELAMQITLHLIALGSRARHIYK